MKCFGNHFVWWVFVMCGIFLCIEGFLIDCDVWCYTVDYLDPDVYSTCECFYIRGHYDSHSTTLKPSTTTEALATTKVPTTVEALTTLKLLSTSSEKSTTIVAPSTSEAPTTSRAPTSPEAPTTTKAPITAKSPTTTTLSMCDYLCHIQEGGAACDCSVSLVPG